MSLQYCVISPICLVFLSRKNVFFSLFNYHQTVVKGLVRLPADSYVHSISFALPWLPPLRSHVFLCVPVCSFAFLCVPLRSHVFLCVPMCSFAFPYVPLRSYMFLCVTTTSAFTMCSFAFPRVNMRSPLYCKIGNKLAFANSCDS